MKRKHRKTRPGAETARSNRCYKDTVFRMLFRDRTRLLGLYNAVTGNDYQDPMVFYNGTAPCPERMLLRLSDAYAGYGRVAEEGEIVGMPAPELELIVQVLNINAGCNEALKAQCQTLGEYMQYVDKVRLYAGSLPIHEAVDRAVDECIDQGILREFLLVNKAEVRYMSIFEYDEEETRRAMRKTEYERGMAEGKAESVLFLLEELGTVPEALRRHILAQCDPEVLQQWLKAAAGAESIASFTRQTGL